MKAYLLCFLLFSVNGLAQVASSSGVQAEVENAIVRVLEKPRYAWSMVFERQWERAWTGGHKESTAAYVYRGETDTVHHYAVVETSVQMMLFGRQDSEDPALLVFHNQDAVARYGGGWHTAREIAGETSDSPRAEIIRRWEERGMTARFSLTIPAPHRILPVICTYLSNFRADDGCILADITSSDVAHLMALGVIEPYPQMTPVALETNSVAAARAAPRGSIVFPVVPTSPEESRRRLYEKNMTGTGTVRFWIRDRLLEKYELNLRPTLALAAKEIEFHGTKEITLTTEFRDDPTSVEVPSEAVELLQGAL